MTDTTPELVPDGWRLHDNRWATLTVNGASMQVRPPKVGELRLIDNVARASGEIIEDAAERIQADAAELDKRVEAGEIPRSTASMRSAVLSREFDDLVVAEWFKVLRTAIENLGDGQLPEEDDLPAWLPASAARQLAILNVHWKTLPPPLGASSTP